MNGWTIVAVPSLAVSAVGFLLNSGASSVGFEVADIAQWGMAGVLVLIVFTWLFKVHLPALDRSRDKERDAWSTAVERGVKAAEVQAASHREAVKEMGAAYRDAIADLTAHQRDTVKSIVDAGNSNKEADRELLRDMIKAVGAMRDVVAKCPMVMAPE